MAIKLPNLPHPADKPDIGPDVFEETIGIFGECAPCYYMPTIPREMLEKLLEELKALEQETLLTHPAPQSAAVP